VIRPEPGLGDPGSGRKHLITETSISPWVTLAPVSLTGADGYNTPMQRIGVTINAILLFLLYISMFASPLSIVFIWVKRVSVYGTETKFGWRQIALLGAQLMVTAAVILVWYWLLTRDSLRWPEEDRYLRQFFRMSMALGVAALAGSLLGTGTAKKATVASSILVMVNWLAVAAFQ
jgi:hypothetical protein